MSSPAQSARKAAVSSGSSCRLHTCNLPCPSQRAWNRASPWTSLPRKLRDPKGMLAVGLAKWQEVLCKGDGPSVIAEQNRTMAALNVGESEKRKSLSLNLSPEVGGLQEEQAGLCHARIV